MAPAGVNVVLGAAGATGLECVKRLLAVTDAPVRAVVRDPAKYPGLFPHDPRLQVVAGDVADPTSLQRCMEGAKGVVFAASGKGYWSAAAVDDEGVGNAAAAAKAAGAARMVLVSSMLVHPDNRWHPIRILLNNIRYSLMDKKFAGENRLRSSGLSYAVIRPGGLTNEPSGGAKIVGYFDQKKEQGSGRISRADVAVVCCEALTNPKADRTTVSLVTEGPMPEGSSLAAQVSSLYAAAAADT